MTDYASDWTAVLIKVFETTCQFNRKYRERKEGRVYVEE